MSASTKNGSRTWIAWESQRRSLTLAQRLGARLHLCLDERLGWLRYPVSIARTIAILARQRGGVVFVQNPSMVLAALACALKRPLGYLLVVDRHSNFSFLRPHAAGPRLRVSDALSGFTLRNADLTIVTNDELRAHVERSGGRAFVLPDPFPDVPEAARVSAANDARNTGSVELLFVSSWASDEPIADTIAACRELGGEAIVRITGRMKPQFASLVAAAPDNFVSTGFLSDAEYFTLMARSDAVIAVTSRAATLVCGGYEAAVMGKPMILGSSSALRSYFNSGAVFTDGSSSDLVRAVRALIRDLPALRAGVRDLVARRAPEWDARFAELQRLLRDRSVRG
jgi:glycosyltransferase involved in cell wall biosynthesis